MEIGQYYQQNQKKISTLTPDDWRAALAKCKNHLKWKLKQKTLSGAHSATNLGADPIDHYLGIAYEKILNGNWNWKDDRTLGQQMIRIVNSEISKEVEKATTEKKKSLILEYHDIENEFYDLAVSPPEENERKKFEQQLENVESAVAGDEALEFLLEGLKEGRKQTELAELMSIDVRQFDKLREKLVRRVQNYKP